MTTTNNNNDNASKTRKQKSPEERARAALNRLQNVEDRLGNAAANAVRQTARILRGQTQLDFVREINAIVEKYQRRNNTNHNSNINS